jgi:hypothetical protein
MLDPATSVGLAGSIIQIIVFVKRVIDRSQELHRSANGTLVHHQELSTLVKSFESHLYELEQQNRTHECSDSVAEGCVDDSGINLEMLSCGAQGVLSQLLDALRSVRSHSRNEKWNSVRQALKTVIRESKINELETRLDRYRTQIDTAMLLSLR